MIFDKGANAERIGSSTNDAGKPEYSYTQKNKVGSYLTPNTKINSKWTEDLNVKPKTIKLLEENIGGKLHDVGFRSDFLGLTPKAQHQKQK